MTGLQKSSSYNHKVTLAIQLKTINLEFSYAINTGGFMQIWSHTIYAVHLAVILVWQFGFDRQI